MGVKTNLCRRRLGPQRNQLEDVFKEIYYRRTKRGNTKSTKKMEWNLYTYNFIKSTRRGFKEKEVWLAVTDMLKELFQEASNAANNCNILCEQIFLKREASCGKREQLLASVRELIDELFIKASGNPDRNLASKCSLEKHKISDVNLKCAPTPITVFTESNNEGTFVDKKKSEISRESQPSSSAAVPRDVRDNQETIQEHSLQESDILEDQIQDQTLIIINEEPCSDLQETESQQHPNYEIAKIREDMQKDAFKCLEIEVDSDEINQGATDQERAPKDNNNKVLQRGRSPKYLPFLSLRDKELEVPPCKKAKLDEHTPGSNTDFELNLINDSQVLLIKTEECVSECNEKITVCLEDITPPLVSTHESSDEDLLVENKTHTSLAESVDITLMQTLLTGEDTRLPQPTPQECDCDNLKDNINSKHDDGTEEHLKTSLLKKITNDDVGQYLHLLENREVVKLPSGEYHTLRSSGVELDVSSFHIDDSISSKQSDKKCECDVTNEVREHQEKITQDDVGQYLQLLKKPHKFKLPSGKCRTLEDEDVEVHVSSSQAIISSERQDEDKYTSNVTNSNRENKLEKVNSKNDQKATESQDDLIQDLNAHTGGDRCSSTDVNTQPINDQMVPSFQGEEDSCYHGDDELYANDEEPKDVKRRRLGNETKEIAPQTSPDLRELKNQQLTSGGAGLVPEYSTADRSNVVSESASSSQAVSVVQVVPQTSSTGMFHWRQEITFQSQLPKPSDSTKPNYPQGAAAGLSQQRPPPLPPCNRKRRVGLSRRQRLSHLHSVSRPPCHQMKMDPFKKHEE